MRNQLLFNLVADLIEKDEDRYKQDTWGNFTTEDGRYREMNAALAAEYHPCNTVGCIAGNAIILSTSQVDMVRAIEEASRQWAKDEIALATVLEHLAEKQGFRYPPIQNYAADLLGIDGESADLLFGAAWFPRYMDVPTALRLIGQGANVTDVTYYAEERVRQAMAEGTSAAWLNRQQMQDNDDYIHADDGTYDGDEG